MFLTVLHVMSVSQRCPCPRLLDRVDETMLHRPRVHYRSELGETRQSCPPRCLSDGRPRCFTAACLMPRSASRVAGQCIMCSVSCAASGPFLDQYIACVPSVQLFYPVDLLGAGEAPPYVLCLRLSSEYSPALETHLSSCRHLGQRQQ